MTDYKKDIKEIKDILKKMKECVKRMNAIYKLSTDIQF